MASELGLDPFLGPGVMVTNVGRGFALNAGLRPGDMIRAVNGQDIRTVRDLVGIATQQGGQWKVTISRGGQDITAQFRT